MVFSRFDFIALNYNQHQLKQKEGLCSVPPLLCALVFHHVSFSLLLLTPHTGCTLSYSCLGTLKYPGLFVYVPIFQPEV